MLKFFHLDITGLNPKLFHLLNILINYLFQLFLLMILILIINFITIYLQEIIIYFVMLQFL